MSDADPAFAGELKFGDRPGEFAFARVELGSRFYCHRLDRGDEGGIAAAFDIRERRFRFGGKARARGDLRLVGKQPATLTPVPGRPAKRTVEGRERAPCVARARPELGETRLDVPAEADGKLVARPRRLGVAHHRPDIRAYAIGVAELPGSFLEQQFDRAVDLA